MQRDLLLYQRALFLRKKKGYSYNEILTEIPVPKSTLSGWLRTVQLSKEQERRIKLTQLEKMQKKWGAQGLGEWNRLKQQREIMDIRAKAREEVTSLSKNEFHIAGIMLYWAEGSKSKNEVRLSNSDPSLIRFMMRWFRECCKVPENQFRASIHYHAGQDELAIRKYWARITDIPLNHFYKSFCKPPGTGHRKHILHYGTMQIRMLRSGDLFHRITSWRDGLIENTISGKSY